MAQHTFFNSSAPVAELGLDEVKSEFQRSLLLIAFFFLVMVLGVLNFLMMSDSVREFFGGIKTVLIIAGSIFGFLVYQALILGNLKKKLDLRRNNTTTFKVFHAIAEITFTSLTTFYLVTELKMGSFTDSQVLLMYFLFIVLSVMHLDERISILTGLVAGAEYAGLVYYEFDIMSQHELFSVSLEHGQYFKAIMLSLCGVAAGFVSLDLRKRIHAANKYHNAKNELEFLFGQQVSREISKTLIEDKSSTKCLDGTVMFVDVRNFTAFADTHTSDEVIEYQNKFIAPVIDIVNQHQGVVFQILGDGLMACFGSPVENVLHADMAFQASVQILKHISAASETGSIPFTQIGIGLHSGPMVTGNIGNEHRKQFSISGTPVIVASRIEQLNKKYGSQLLISEEVFNRIAPGKIEITYLGKEMIKGIEKSVTIYKVA